jgi:hypothetical protein
MYELFIFDIEQILISKKTINLKYTELFLSIYLNLIRVAAYFRMRFIFYLNFKIYELFIFDIK